MATTFIQDTFTEAADTALASHTPDVGGAWAAHPSYAATASVLASEDRAQGSSTTVTALYLNATTPASADYEVRATARIVTAASARCGVAGRFDAAANTGYWLYYSGSQWDLVRLNAGTATILGSYNGSETLNTDYALRLVMHSNRIEAYIAGTLRINVADSAPITAVGQAGLSVRLNGRIDGFEAVTLDTQPPQFSQEAVEVLSQGNPQPQLSQVAVEVLSSFVSFPDLYQLVAEVVVREAALLSDAPVVIGGTADLALGLQLEAEATPEIAGTATLETGSTFIASPGTFSGEAEGDLETVASFDDEIEIDFNGVADLNLGIELRPTTQDIAVEMRGNLRVGPADVSLGSFFLIF